MVHRIATQKIDGCGYNVSLKEIHNEWSLDDVLDAHDVLDLYIKVQEKSYKDMKK